MIHREISQTSGYLRPSARRKRAGKKKKKTLILTLGSPPEKGWGKKKPWAGPTPTQWTRWKRAKKKTLGSSLDLDFRTSISGPGFQDLDLKTWVSRLRQTHVTHPTVVSSFPIIFLCVHRHFSFSRHVVCASSGHRQTASSGTHRQVN
jgi:hypothetical protein